MSAVRRQPASLLLAVAVTVLAAASTGHLAAQQNTCDGCVQATFWPVDPDAWKKTDPLAFPETGKLPAESRDLGIAFSGGGTRAATAALGQLRGLKENGWLARVRYMTAVSGGSWTAVPYEYYAEDLDLLLGKSNSLDPEKVKTEATGKMAERIVHSGLGHVGLQEIPGFLGDEGNVGLFADAFSTIRGAIRRLRNRDLPEPNRRDKAYAHMLGQVFLGSNRTFKDPIVERGNLVPYTWNRATASEITATTGFPATELVQVPPNRPFLIVGGTLISQRQGLAYPTLMPVEYTPLYTGIRQTYGNIGGTYVSPWAYDRRFVAKGPDGKILVSPGPAGRPFTLADMIGSSGAAPQLHLLLGSSLPARVRAQARQVAEAFPSFANLAVRGTEPIATGDVMPHGDGGFTDNLGLMPLLARQVRHILVFVNSNKTWSRNDQLQSYFSSLSLRDGNGDKSMNQVFAREHYEHVLEGLDAATAAGGPAVYCSESPWKVEPNERYNIRGYEGVTICWVYNHAAKKWTQGDGLHAKVKEWLAWDKKDKARPEEAKSLEHFPYYATFGENKPRVIKLSTLQVNLLADLASWSVTNADSRQRIEKAFGDVLK